MRLIVSSLGNGRLWLLYLSLQVPSLRALFKYAPGDWAWGAVPLYLILTWIWCALLLNPEGFPARGERLLNRGWFAGALIAIILMASLIIYPQADALKYEGRGSDQDDALIITGTRLWEGRNPYEGKVWPHESAAAGPGWVILASPLAASGGYALLNPLMIGITALGLTRLRKRRATASIFLLLLMSSLAFWELTLSGSDMISIGCLILLGVMAVHRAWIGQAAESGERKAEGPSDGRLSPRERGDKRGVSGRVFSALLLAFAATSRAIFFFLIPLVWGYLRRQGRQIRIRFLLLSGFLFLTTHIGFFLWSPHWYLPLHVFWKAVVLMGPWRLGLALAVCGVVMIWVIRRVEDTAESWRFHAWLMVGVVVAAAGMGDLLSCGFVLANWEGANYTAVQMALAAAWGASARWRSPMPMMERAG